MQRYPFLSHALSVLFFFNDPATTEIYTLSLHDALPISGSRRWRPPPVPLPSRGRWWSRVRPEIGKHTSELQSHLNLVCRLLLEKKKKKARCNKIAKQTQKKKTQDKE